MDRRYVLALLFSVLILIAYPHYLHWIGADQPRTAPVEKTEAPDVVTPAPSLPEPPAPAEVFPLKNPLYELIFASRGGNILSLKERDNVLFEAGAGEGGIFGVRILHEEEDLSQEVFQKDASAGEDSPPRFVYEKAGEYRVTKTFFVGKDRPTLILEVGLENLSSREKHFPLEMEYGLALDLHGRPDETKVKVAHSFADEVRTTSLGAVKKKPFITAEPLDWQGLLRQHSCILIKPDAKLVGQETRFDSDRLMSRLRLAPITVAPGGRETTRFLIYAGPQRYETLREFGFGFEKILSQGILGILHLGLLLVLHFFYHLTGNYGAAILLLTLLIKILFTPLTHVSYESMKKMQALQPKIKSIQKHHQKDAARMNKEMMELYRRNRVNPMMGCLPLVLQIPIFISFYQALSDAVELKGAPFIWWIKDLSAPDRLFTLPTVLPFIGDAVNVLPILMIGSMLWQQKLTPQAAASPGQEKIMYLMPVIFGFVFYNLPSGLVLYWFVNNLLTIFHQLVIKRIPVILHHEDADHTSH